MNVIDSHAHKLVSPVLPLLMLLLTCQQYDHLASKNFQVHIVQRQQRGAAKVSKGSNRTMITGQKNCYSKGVISMDVITVSLTPTHNHYTHKQQAANHS